MCNTCEDTEIRTSAPRCPQLTCKPYFLCCFIPFKLPVLHIIYWCLSFCIRYICLMPSEAVRSFRVCLEQLYKAKQSKIKRRQSENCHLKPSHMGLNKQHSHCQHCYWAGMKSGSLPICHNNKRIQLSWQRRHSVSSHINTLTKCAHVHI